VLTFDAISFTVKGGHAGQKGLYRDLEAFIEEFNYAMRREADLHEPQKSLEMLFLSFRQSLSGNPEMRHEQTTAVYILASKRNGTLYVGDFRLVFIR